MSKLTRRTVILAVAEPTYAAPAAVPVAANGIMVNTGLSLTVAGDKIERDNVRDSLTPQGHVIGAKSVSLELSVEAKGGGLAGAALVPPEYDCLLKACALARTDVTILPVDDSSEFVLGNEVEAGAATATVIAVTPGTVVVAGVDGVIASGASLEVSGTASATITAAPYPGLAYSPVSDPAAMASAAVWFHRDGILHKTHGMRGSVALDCQVGKIPTLKFTLKGLFTDPEDAALPTPTLSQVTPPVCVGLGLRLGGYTPVANKLSLDLKNELQERQDLNAPEGLIEIIITKRAPAGSLDPEAAALAEYNPWAAWKSATPAAVTARIGSAPGNRLTVVAPKVLYDEIKYADRNGAVAYDLPFTCTGVKDDEMVLIFS